MDNNISQQFINNVRFLCEVRNINIGILEKESGASIGYTSRFINNNKKKMSLQIAYKISILLDVSIEDLIEKDYKKIFEKEQLEIELENIKKRAYEIESLLNSRNLHGVL